MSTQQTLGAFGALGQLAQAGNLDLTNVKTERPVLTGGSLHRWKIVTSTVDPGKTDPNKLNWVLELELLTPGEDTKGRPVQPGELKLKHYTGLVATEKRTTDMVLSDVCRILDALYGEEVRKTIKLDTFPLDSVVGGEVTTKVSVDPAQEATETRPATDEQNRLRFVKKGD